MAGPAGRGSVGRAHLVVEHGPRAERIRVNGVATIGRDRSNEVAIDDSTISGHHATLVYREGRWWIEDAGSTNGTWVNRRPVHGPQTVEIGDLIQVGRVSLRLTE